MTIEEAVLSRIVNLATVTALVGTRVWLQRLPQSPTYPCVRVTLVSDLGDQHLRGPQGEKRARVQVDAFAHETSGGNPYTGAAAVWQAIYGDGKGPDATGVFGWTGTVDDVTISLVEDAGRRVAYDPDELRVVTVTQDFRVWYRT